MKGENIDVESESFDYVIGTHVLCSVDSVSEVLKQVSRALKLHGTYIFYEHVLSPDDENLRWYQELFAPIFFYVGNGCKFRELWKDVSGETTHLPNFEVNVSHIIAPVPMPIIKPHISGYAVKMS